MNKVVWKDNLREVRKSLPRFLSIFAIIALGVAFFIGIRATGPSMLSTARNYFESYNLPDGQILSTMGLNEDDLDILNAQEGIRFLPIKSLEATVQPSNETAKIFPYFGDEEADIFNVVEGRLPETTTEIALDAKYLEMLNETLDEPIQIGSIINLEMDEVETESETDTNDNDDETAIETDIQAPTLIETEFEVVGFVSTPLYFERISRGSGQANVFGVVADNAIEGDIYSEAFYWVEDAAEMDAYTENYNQTVLAVDEQLEAVLYTRPAERLAELQEELTDLINEGQAEIDDGYQQLNEAAVALEDAEQELLDGWASYYDGLDELAAGEEEYYAGLAEFESGQADYEVGLAELESAEELLAEQEEIYQEGLAAYQEGLTLFYDGIAAGEEELISGQTALDQVEAELAAGYQELVSGQAALDEGRAALQAGRQQFVDEIVSELSQGELTPLEVIASIGEQRLQLQEAQAALQTQIDQLDSELSPELVAQLENTLGQLAELDQFLGQSESTLSQLANGEISLDQAQADLLEGNEALADLLEQLGVPTDLSATEVVAALQEERANLQTEIEDLRSQLDDIPQQIATLEEKNLRLNAEIADLENTLTNDRQSLETLNSAISQAQEDVTQAQTSYQSHQSNLSSQEASLQNLINQRDALLQAEEVDEAQIAQLNEQIASQEAVVNQGRVEVDNSQTALTQAEAQLLQLTEQQVLLEENIRSNEALLSEKQNQLATNQIELERLQTLDDNIDRDAIQTQLDELLAEEEDLNNQITQLTAAIEQLEAAERQINEGQAALDQGWQDYQSGWSQFQAGQAAIDQGWSVLETERAQGLAELNAAAEELESGRQLLDEGWQELEDGRQTLAEAAEQLEEAEAALEEGRLELDDGRYTAMDGRIALEIGQENLRAGQLAFNEEASEALVQLREAQMQLQTAKDAYNDLEEPIYLTNLRDSFDAYQSVQDNAEQIEAISNIFPVFFFGIAILVTYTTIKRMGSEQRNYMGTMKQMGYKNRTIIAKFVTYAGIASVLGSIVGLVLGYLIFPPVIIGAYNSMFYFSEPFVANSWSMNILVAIIGLSCALVPAIATPHQLLKTQPALLLQPEPPKAGKKTLIERFTLLWNNLGFKTQMTIRNLLRYKGRNSMTLIGVAGCTMLIVTGFGISTSITGIVESQFQEIHTYDSMVMLNEDTSSSEQGEIEDYLAENSEVADFTRVASLTLDTNSDEPSQSVTVVVPMDDSFTNLFNIRERDAENNIDLVSSGPVLTERLKEYLNVEAGDTVRLQNSDLENFELPIEYIAENYIGHYIYLSAEDYQTYFSELPEINSYYIQYQEGVAGDTIEEALAEMDQVLTTINVETISRSATDAMSSLDLITIVLIISAAGLAFVVLYNLTNINVAERMRELSTIKVLGFYNREVTMYIAAEVLVLTFLGSLVGLVLGTVLNHYILKTMQLSNLLFHPRITLMDYLLSVIITFIFTIVVMVSMHFKLKKIDMVEALKAVD